MKTVTAKHINNILKKEVLIAEHLCADTAKSLGFTPRSKIYFVQAVQSSGEIISKKFTDIDAAIEKYNEL